MEIKRKFELHIATNRRYLIRQSSSETQIPCVKCGGPILTTEQAAGIFGITQRRIFQIIENDAVSFIETKEGVVMICLDSLAKFLNEN